LIIHKLHDSQGEEKRKYVTAVAGLDTVPDLKIKDAARVFGKKFSSGKENVPQMITV
jgi:translation initiation factor 1 (eIF-1/SUI1)